MYACCCCCCCAELQRASCYSDADCEQLQRWTCSLCLSLLHNPSILPCKHLFCSKCISTLAIHTAVNTESNPAPLQEAQEALCNALVPCLLCRALFTQYQALDATAVLSEMQAARLPCKRSSEGCTVQISPLQIDELEAECQYATGEHIHTMLLLLLLLEV
jgi:Zinc finger, C3HC4 type (RING finger)